MTIRRAVLAAASGLLATGGGTRLRSSAVAEALDNGLARTPPMGWLGWERFGCGVDCAAHPAACVSERLVLAQARALVDGGYRDAGYRYVNIDDCWSEKERDGAGRLVADRRRFPRGLRALARDVHAMGLLMGLYGAIGAATCAGYPGFEGHFEQDARQLAEFEVDSIKVDGCGADPSAFNRTYPAFGRALNATGRPILYNCQWPLYDRPTHHGERPDVLTRAVAATCNQWRNYYDIFDDWTSVRATVDFWSRSAPNDTLVRAAGPGHWNDPDALLVGNPGLSLSEQQAQFALWAVFAAPLLVAADLRDMPATGAAILLNEEVIAVNQDVMGHQGYCAEGANTNVRVYVRELLPASGAPCERGTSDTWTVVLANFMSIFNERDIVFDPKVHLPNGDDWHSFQARDLINHADLGTYDKLSVSVDESSVRMFKVTRSSSVLSTSTN